MALPPGRRPIPAPGINAATDPELAKAAAELNAWLDYLSHPSTNNGPRIYRPVPGQDKTPDGQQLHDMPSGHPLDLEGDPHYTVVSALDGYASNPGELFKSAEAVSGVDEAVINQAYSALTQGCFTFPPPEGHRSGAEPADQSSGGHADGPVRDGDMYGELGQIRTDWLSMRYGWTAPEHDMAQLFEDDMIRFQVYVENGFLRIAEAVVKYRAIFQKAGQDMAKLMDALTQRFASYREGDALSIDLRSFLLTGITEVACAVISGGVSTVFKVKTLAEVATQMIGDAGKTAKQDDNPIDVHEFLADTVKQYLQGMAKIERDCASAIGDLWLNLHSRLGELEQRRRYQNLDTKATSDMAPQFADYAARWRV